MNAVAISVIQSLRSVKSHKLTPEEKAETGYNDGFRGHDYKKFLKAKKQTAIARTHDDYAISR